jgi:hypothetical protein
MAKEIAFTDYFTGKSVLVSLGAHSHPLSPVQLRAQIKRPLQLVEAAARLFVRRWPGRQRYQDQPHPPLRHIIGEYSPVVPVRFMFGCVVAACERLVTAPGDTNVDYWTGRRWTELVVDRVMRGHACKVQVLMRPRALIAASFADCASVCTRHELCDFSCRKPSAIGWCAAPRSRSAAPSSLSRCAFLLTPCSQAAAVAATRARSAIVTPRAFVTAAYDGDIALVYYCLVADAASVHMNGGGAL